jgi:hypothetical protein
MATRMSTSGEIAARVKRLEPYGFKVTKPRSLGGAYKITCPDGYVVQVHLTPSDTNAHRVILRDLNNHGLKQAEERYAADRAEARQRALDDDRRKAEAASEALIKRTAVLARAAGPYGVPEYVELDWFTQSHPAPWMRWVIMTPELAKDLLKLNADNRPLTPATVEHYERIILSGRWHLTHQGMAMDTRPLVQDGQHRLHAIANTGVEVPVPFFVGMPVENFAAIDEGRNRRIADLLGKDGERYSVLLQSMIKLMAQYRSDAPRSSRSAKVTNEEGLSMFGGDADEIRRAAHFAASKTKRADIPPTALGVAWYLLRETNGRDNPYVQAFFNGLVTELKGDTRVKLDEGDARLKVRDNIGNRRRTGKRIAAIDQLALIIQAWNYCVEGRRVNHVKVTSDKAVPRISLCHPDLSATPALLAGEIEYAARQLAAERDAAAERQGVQLVAA